MMERWVVAYDVPDDRRRTKLAEILEDFGDRTQRSVFEVNTRKDEFELLVRRITALIEPGEDAVRLYPLCNACYPKVMDLGLSEKKPFDEPDLIIV
ncbi:MAG: CRISPR-associated endonuclease Cas2 [Candidatus Hydrogenedentes bacterium]|nr:CRISPR-associated endonuclease Cas2 [Candidatus Hydrogenedentota bacterium]